MSTQTETAPTAVAKMSLPTLTAMVVGSMVGAGVFSLPALVVSSLAVQALLALTLVVTDAGLKFILLMTVILAPATLLYVKARGEHGRRLFSPTELGLFVLIAIGGVSGAVGLRTGRITL